MRLGIIGAMEVEVATLRDEMRVKRVVTRANMEFCEGALGDCPAVVVRCGIGKVNAAACAQILVSEFDVTNVINTGVAGSLDNAIEIGDVVVSTDAVHHDMDVTGLGYAPGQLPDLDVLAIPADDDMRRRAVEACRAVAPEIGVFEGRVASGDQFIAKHARKAAIAAEFGAMCCEMEGAPIAQVCYLNGVPFVVVRAISDKADGSKKVLYPIFEKRAAERCAKIVAHLARSLA